MAAIPVFGSRDLVPGAVAGLNLLDVVRYEDPRLGAEFRYGFPPFCKADAYLYNLGLMGIPDDLHSPPVLEAFKQSYEGVLQAAKTGATRDLEVLSSSILTLPGDSAAPFCYHASFAYGENEHGPVSAKGILNSERTDEYISSDVGRLRSHLAVRSDKGFINKVRFTYIERATEPSYFGLDPEDIPEHLRGDVPFVGFWRFLLAWTRAVQGAPTPATDAVVGDSTPRPAAFVTSPRPVPDQAEAATPQPAAAGLSGGPGATTFPPPNAGVCQVCRRAPAAPLKLVQQTGMVFSRRSGTMDAVLCQSCGTALFRQAQSHNLALGWWGIVSFFTNFFSLGGNAFRSMKHRLIGPPAGMPFAGALDPDRPVWLRWQIVVPVILAGLAVFGIISSTSHQQVGGLHAGQCINVPASGTFTDVTLVPCEEPHDAEVAGVIPASSASSTDIEKECVDMAVANVLLSRAQSVEPSILVRSEKAGNTGGTKTSSDSARAVCILVGKDSTKLTGRVTGGEGRR